jgi:biopolymer transport protein ExbD
LSGLDEQRPSRRLWVSAAVIALALHVGGAALAITQLQTEEADDALGASAIEVGLELASVHREVTDLPPGPDTDASAASPQLNEQKAEVKETDLPQDKPTYVSIKPDLSVAIGENMVKRVDLVRSLDAMADSSKDRYIFLRADRAVPYGELMDVLEILRSGGYTKLKLVALEGVPDAAAAQAAPAKP